MRANQEQLARSKILGRLQLCDDVRKVHVDEVVAHELSVGDQVFEFKFQQFARRLFFVEQVERLHLLEHFQLDDGAPDGFHVV